MTNLTTQLTKSLEAETNILQFTLPDHKEQSEKLAAIHHDAIVKRTASISKAKVSLRRTIEKLEAEIARLEGQITEAKDSAEKLIEADQKIIAASKAFIEVLEGE